MSYTGNKIGFTLTTLRRVCLKNTDKFFKKLNDLPKGKKIDEINEIFLKPNSPDLR